MVAYTAVGSQPLNISNAKTKMAYFQPKTRKTLVAPALPLPCSLISIFFITRVITILVGNDPVI